MLVPEIEVILYKKKIAEKEIMFLLQLFQHLKVDELKLLDQYLRSPYFVSNPRPHLLFKQFRRTITQNKGGEKCRINGTSLLKKVFGKSETDEEKVIKKLSGELKFLGELISDFFIYQGIRDQPQQKAVIAVEVFKKRMDIELFKEAAAKFRRLLEDEPPSIMRLAGEWWLDHQLYYYQGSEKYEVDSRYFHSSNKNITRFHQLTSLRYFTENINRSNLLNEPIQIPEKYAGLLELPEDELVAPVFQTYIALIRLLQCRDQMELHQSFRELVLQHQDQVSSEDLLVFIKGAQNAGNFALEKGVKGIEEYLFFWARLGVMTKVFVFNNLMSDGDFLNVALTAATCGQFEWQLEFMNEYRNALKEKNREKTYQLALAFYYFHQEDYQETIRTIDVHFPKNAQNDVIFTLRVKTLLVRSHLVHYLKETWDYEVYRDVVERLRKHIERLELLTDNRLEPYHNFIMVCNSIISYNRKRIDLRKIERQELKEKLLIDVNQLPQLTCRVWIRRLIEGLS